MKLDIAYETSAEDGTDAISRLILPHETYHKISRQDFQD